MSSHARSLLSTSSGSVEKWSKLPGWRSQRPEECGALTKTATGEATSALAVLKVGIPGEGIPQMFGKLDESEKWLPPVSDSEDSTARLESNFMTFCTSIPERYDSCRLNLLCIILPLLRFTRKHWQKCSPACRRRPWRSSGRISFWTSSDWPQQAKTSSSSPLPDCTSLQMLACKLVVYISIAFPLWLVTSCLQLKAPGKTRTRLGQNYWVVQRDLPSAQGDGRGQWHGCQLMKVLNRVMENAVE